MLGCMVQQDAHGDGDVADEWDAVDGALLKVLTHVEYAALPEELEV
jgi:hypothetical protein